MPPLLYILRLIVLRRSIWCLTCPLHHGSTSPFRRVTSRFKSNYPVDRRLLSMLPQGQLLKLFDDLTKVAPLREI